MAKMLFLPAVAVSLAALYLISRNRKFEFELETKLEPREHHDESRANIANVMEEGIE